MIYDKNTVYAAGTLCWRRIDGVIHLLVIHRTVQQDDTFPKGKLDPGETLPAAAVRETWEETGLNVTLGAPLGFRRYDLSNGKVKEVHYWCAEVSDKAARRSTFTANDEVESVRWVPLDQVAQTLSYELDRDLLDAFTTLMNEDALETFAVILLRHAKALDASTYHEPDQKRPLATRGRHQAEEIVTALAAFGPSKVISSSSIRCIQTVEPFSVAHSKKIKKKDAISQHRFDDGEPEARDLIAKRLAKGKNAIICSHGPVLPALLRELALATDTDITNAVSLSSRLDTAAFSVYHIRRNEPRSPIVAIETHDPLV